MGEIESRLKLEEGEIPLREGILKFPSSPEEEPHIIASRCRSCGDIAFPPKVFCGKCECEELEEILLSNVGKVYTYTVVRQMGIPGIDVPYILVVVKFPEDDELLIAGQMTGCNLEEVRIGMDVETIIDKVRSGLPNMMTGESRDVIGYKFRPVGKKGFK